MKMGVGKKYIVTKKSKDGTFLTGDHIAINEDGSISCVEAHGWIDANEVPSATEGIEVEIDSEWVERTKKIIDELEKLIGEK